MRCGSSQAPATTGAPPAAAPTAQPSASTPRDWPMFGRVPSRTSSTGAIGITAVDAPHLKRRRVDLPGVVDSAPVFLHGVQAGGAERDLFVVNTIYGRVVAVDATAAKIVWTFTPKGHAGWEGSYRVTKRHTGGLGRPAVRLLRLADGRIHKLSIADGAEQAAAGRSRSPSCPSARRSRRRSA